MATDTTPNPLEMPDEDILNMTAPPVVEDKQEEVVEEKTDDTSAETGSGEGAADDTKTEEKVEEKSEDKTDDNTDDKTEAKEPEVKIEDLSDEDILAGKGKAKPAEDKKPADKEEKQEEKTDDKSKSDEKTDKKDEVKDESKKDETKEAAVEVNFEEGYKKIMAPFKANGKTIELRSPEEAIKLMQLGANYTKRMQELTPHRKTLMMLESNKITQDDLSLLIDVRNKNPEAIKKLLKDSDVDPMDIDVSTDANYQPSNHGVDDAAVNFKTVMDEVSSTPEGLESLTAINSWDDTSKEALWEKPEIMSVIHEHRSSGVYDTIKNEVDRRITLGDIPAGTPFLQAYKAVGDEMAAAALEASKAETTEQKESGTKTEPTESQGGTVVATRAATPKSAIKDNDKAAAASMTRSSPVKVEPQKNFLAMSDEDFLNQMSGRV